MNHPLPSDGQRVKDDDTAHVFHSWSAQKLIDPVPVASAEGSRFTDHAGKTYLDFSSGLVHANLGYQHPKMVEAIQKAAAQMCTLAPGFAYESRSTAARLISEKAPDGMDMVFFTNGGAEATENAIRMARLHTGRHKILATYRSYHGATAGAITMTGDPRRWPSEPSMPGVLHLRRPCPYRSPPPSRAPEVARVRAPQRRRDVLMVQGAQTLAAICGGADVGTDGTLDAPEGYPAGLRAICG